MTPLRLLLAALLLTTLPACSLSAPTAREDTGRRDALVAAVGAARLGAVLDLRQVLGGDWDRVAFFGPYSHNDDAERLLGFPLDIQRVSEWTYTEGGTVLVLAAADDVVAWFGVDHGHVRLTCMDGLVIEAAEANLTVVEEMPFLRGLAAAEHHACGYLLR